MLAFTTGEENLSADPQAWWLWWNDYNEVFVAGQAGLKDGALVSLPGDEKAEELDEITETAQVTR